MTKELPEKWFMVCTKENQDVANEWRKNIATEIKDYKVPIDNLFLSKHIEDYTYFFSGTIKTFKANDDFKEYQEITFEQFKKHVLKENKTMSSIQRTISAKQAQEIIDNISTNCAWKETLINKYGRDILFNIPITINEKQYKAGFDAATSEQKQLLLSIIGEPHNTEINLFKKTGIYDLEPYMTDGGHSYSLISIRSFGEYENKAFYLNNDFEWSIKKDNHNELCLIPKHK